MAEIRALDHDRSALIEWTRGPPDPINAGALITSVIMVLIRSYGDHCDRQITIRRRKKGAFYNVICVDHPGRRSRSDGYDLFETVHNGPFHHNRRSFRSDGYAQNMYKMRGSSDVLSIRVGNQSN